MPAAPLRFPKVHYSLLHPSREFELDRETGRLRVHASKIDGASTDSKRKLPALLDRERRDTYELTVIAEDDGDPPRRSSAVIHITLSDENDHAPEFLFPVPHSPGSILNLSCTQLGHQVIARVIANDSDVGRNSEIEYKILRVQTTTTTKRATRDSDAGLRAMEEEDVNQGQPKEDDEITPRNDRAQNSTLKNMFLRNNSALTTKDTKLASSPSYLLHGPTNDHFEINNHNGQLFLIHPVLDCSQPAEIRLTIEAQDGGIPPRSSTAVLTIRVNSDDHNLMHSSVKTSRIEGDLGNDVAVNNKFVYSNRLHSRINVPDSRQRRKLVHHHVSNPAAKHFTVSSHWSTVVGLVVAMVILVLLLCLTLIVFRKNFTTTGGKPPERSEHPIIVRFNQKYKRSEEPEAECKAEKFSWADAAHSGIHYGSSRKAALANEVPIGSPCHSSLSPATMTQVDELSYSPINLEVDPSTMSAQYFETLPGLPALNDGRIAVLHHNGRLRCDKHRRVCSTAYGMEMSGDFANKTPNRSSGQREPLLEGSVMTTGYPYQTLKPRHPCAQQTESSTMDRKTTLRRNVDFLGCNVQLGENKCTACTKNGSYMQLLYTPTVIDKACVPRPQRNSQLDLTDRIRNKVRDNEFIVDEKSTDSMQSVRDRASSLTELTFQQEDHTTGDCTDPRREFKCQTSKPRTGKCTLVACNRSNLSQPKVQPTKQYTTVPKAVMVGMAPQAGGHKIRTYSVSSFV
ncbi:unnamed protein product [Dicrocoelium dendriticum]|nr:unnamed protein product [Dicrocoelium dendriticum]